MRIKFLDSKESGKDFGDLSVRVKCFLLGVNRSNLYYKPRNVEELNNLCNEIYEIWQKYQFFGYRRITAILRAEKGYDINSKKVLRLMRLLEVKAIYPKKKMMTIINKKDYKFPYLLQDLVIKRPNQAWSTDITYIKTPVGFVYLTALIDIFSRFVISWKLSISMSNEFCIDILKKGIRSYKAPEIVNSDQGSQFTSNDWVKTLKNNNIQISMDGKGRWVDNVLIERFWRTIKQEQIYINPPDNIEQLRTGIDKFIKFYNYQRPHQSLNYRTPLQVYFNDDNKKRGIKF